MLLLALLVPPTVRMLSALMDSAAMIDDITVLSFKSRLQQKYDESRARKMEEVEKKEQALAEQASAWFTCAQDDLVKAMFAAIEDIEEDDKALSLSVTVERHPDQVDALYATHIKTGFQQVFQRFGFDTHSVQITCKPGKWEFKLSGIDVVHQKPEPRLKAIGPLTNVNAAVNEPEDIRRIGGTPGGNLRASTAAQMMKSKREPASDPEMPPPLKRTNRTSTAGGAYSSAGSSAGGTPYPPDLFSLVKKVKKDK